MHRGGAEPPDLGPLPKAALPLKLSCDKKPQNRVRRLTSKTLRLTDSCNTGYLLRLAQRRTPELITAKEILACRAGGCDGSCNTFRTAARGTCLGRSGFGRVGSSRIALPPFPTPLGPPLPSPGRGRAAGLTEQSTDWLLVPGAPTATATKQLCACVELLLGRLPCWKVLACRKACALLLPHEELGFTEGRQQCGGENSIRRGRRQPGLPCPMLGQLNAACGAAGVLIADLTGSCR